jgi:hypothetical protein
MKHRVIIFFLLLSVIQLDGKSAVTYNFSGGRFGDSLIAYCHAFWIAYIFDLDLLYKPFKYSEQMLMHETDTLYSNNSIQNYKQILHISHAFISGVQPDILYIVPFFCESHIEHDDPRCPFLFQVDWKNKDFIKALKKRIAPKYQLSLPQLPDEGITIALHVRKGTGWDIPKFAPTFEKLTEMHPLKWPPDSYYIEQIKKLIEFFPNQKLYIYLFTDHDKPLEIIEKYQKIVNSPHIVWSCRQQENSQDLNVLEDFFALMQFDCLIRNDSNFSIIASKLGDYQILIAPWGSKMNSGQIIIDEVLIEAN